MFTLLPTLPPTSQVCPPPSLCHPPVARQHFPSEDTHLPSGFSALNLVLIANWVGEQADVGWMRSRYRGPGWGAPDAAKHRREAKVTFWLSHILICLTGFIFREERGRNCDRKRRISARMRYFHPWQIETQQRVNAAAFTSQLFNQLITNKLWKVALIGWREAEKC